MTENECEAIAYDVRHYIVAGVAPEMHSVMCQRAARVLPATRSPAGWGAILPIYVPVKGCDENLRLTVQSHKFVVDLHVFLHSDSSGARRMVESRQLYESEARELYQRYADRLANWSFDDFFKWEGCLRKGCGVLLHFYLPVDWSNWECVPDNQREIISATYALLRRAFAGLKLVNYSFETILDADAPMKDAASDVLSDRRRESATMEHFTAPDVIHYLKEDKNGFVDVGDEVLKPCMLTNGGDICANDNFLQYKRRWPATVDNSTHYELQCKGNQIAVVFHVEKKTDGQFPKGVIQERLQNAVFPGSGMKFTYGVLRCEESVDCYSGCSMVEAAESAKNLLKKLYQVAEPILKGIEADVSAGVVLSEMHTELLRGAVGDVTHEMRGMDACEREDPVDNLLPVDEDPFAGGARAVVITLDQLLAMPLRIPSYQRPYKWTRRNVEGLLCDIQGALAKKSSDAADAPPLKYRLGTIIVDASRHDGKFDIVDGQQRVLTLLLINRAIEAIRQNRFVCPIQTDTETLEHLVGNLEARRNLHENYSVVRSLLAKNYDLRKKFVLAFGTTLEVVVVRVDRLPEAFQLFDSQNTRGRPLDPHDLLKAFHLRAMRGEAGLTKEEARAVVEEWESHNSGALRDLFDKWLFRISNWMQKRRTHTFSAQDILEFKGVPSNSPYSFAVRARAAMPGSDDAVLCRRFQLGADFVEGREFFRMVSYYKRLVDEIKKGLGINETVDLKNVLANDDGSRGFEKIIALFRCAMLCYVDRFGKDALKETRALRKICLWAFMLRLNMAHVSDDTVNRYAVIDGGADYTNVLPLFALIKAARSPSDVVLADVYGAGSRRYRRKDGEKGRENLLKALMALEA